VLEQEWLRSCAGVVVVVVVVCLSGCLLVVCLSVSGLYLFVCLCTGYEMTCWLH
jgi:hypothetical protein